MVYKDWVNNEYKLFIQALKECTVINFKEHPMVRRMLSLDMDNKYSAYYKISSETVGIETDMLDDDEKPGYLYRMIYYAQKVLSASPSAICEIGGGVGQFYAILRALGYKGEYYIYDLPEVKKFQRKYLDEVTKRTGLQTQQIKGDDFDFCCSFYALGEFDNETKKWYIENVVNKCPHGLIIWNDHFEEDKENLELIKKLKPNCIIKQEFPLTAPLNKEITF